MKRFFKILLFSLLSITAFGQGSLVKPISGGGGGSFSQATPRAFSNTIVFDTYDQSMTYRNPTGNVMLTTVTASNTDSFCHATIIVGPTSFRVQVDTSKIKLAGAVPDSTKWNVFYIDYSNADSKPVCRVSYDLSYPLASQVFYSDSVVATNNISAMADGGFDLAFFGDHPFSVSYWINLTAGGSNHDVIVRKDGSNFPWLSYINTTGYPSFYIGDSLGHTSTHVAIDKLITTGTWHHIVNTYDGTKLASGMDVWVDGVQSLAGTKTNTGTLVTSDHAGTMSIGLASNINFKVTQLMVADIKLTPTQIAEIYNGGSHFDINSASFYAANVKAWFNWRNRQFADMTGNGHALTTTTENTSTDFR